MSEVAAAEVPSEVLAHKICVLKMQDSLVRACAKAGGGSWSTLKDRPLSEVIEILAPNGVRFYHTDNGAVENLLAQLDKFS